MKPLSNALRTLACTALALCGLPAAAMIWNFPGTNGSPPPGPVVAGVPLTDGKVLLIGNNFTRLLYAEYLAWQTLAPTSIARTGFAAVALPSGQVLVTGGSVAGSASDSAERYDPSLDAWAGSPPMPVARASHLAVRLAGGVVLVVGGVDGAGATKHSADRFDEATASWSAAGTFPWDVRSPSARLFALSDGRAAVVHAGGIGLFDPASSQWTDAAPPPMAGGVSTPPVATQLADGRIVVATMGTYDAATDSWRTITPPPRQFGAAASLPGLRAMFAGSDIVPCANQTCFSSIGYEYSVLTDTWSQVPDTIGVFAPDFTLDNGAYFATIVRTPQGWYEASGAVYRRSRLSKLRIANPFDLPLLPSPGQSYFVDVELATESEALNRPMSGSLTISDGTATCTFAPPATGCTLTTIDAGSKTITVAYPGDDNYRPAAISYEVAPHVIVDRTFNVRVSSNPFGLFDTGVVVGTAAAFAPDSPVVVSAVADSGYTFTGWLGDCVGTTPCAFNMPADRHVRVKAFASANEHAPINIDVDRDGGVSAASDGLMIMRYLLGQPEGAVVNGAMPITGAPPGGTVTDYLAGIRPRLDVDGNGIADARTDGLLILRYLAGFRGDALIANCVGSNARRASAADIESYLATLLP